MLGVLRLAPAVRVGRELESRNRCVGPERDLAASVRADERLPGHLDGDGLAGLERGVGDEADAVAVGVGLDLLAEANQARRLGSRWRVQ